MAVHGIGTPVAGGPGGRGGVVIGSHRLPGDRVALRIRGDEPAPATPTPNGPDIQPSAVVPPADPSPPRLATPSVARTPDRLAPTERAAVDRLRQRDAQVRQEEQAHAAAAGALAGPIAYVYQ
ncbi:MAG: hypothetical protein HKM95_14700, partial [Inquilinus sp.]|nr:hypothetical protein [Inquilinus sp.]